MMQRVVNRIRALPRPWLVAAGSLLGLVVVVGSAGMYRVYDYVQHDNDFCMNCHLMASPYERFEKSQHRGLGCKACHRPNIIDRSKMGLRQILEMPDSITHHAEVPREICGECHESGNAEEWKQIATSVGHRLHLDSNNPSLAKIECLDCHGAGIHEFAAVDKTCGKVGCHENVTVKLGKMSELSIHCTSCHDFSKPVAAGLNADSLKRAITPQRPDCTSCHAMRQKLTDFPADEPHDAMCGSCHNPHDQRTPGDAVRSCASGSCHQNIDTVSPMHRKLASGVAQKCTMCHQAHTWKTKADACTSCHSVDKLDDDAMRPIRKIAAPPARMSVLGAALLPINLALQLLSQNPADAPNSPFRHKPHKQVACLECHENQSGHGVLKLRTAADCSGCHHSQTRARQCAACHEAGKLGRAFSRTFTTTTSVNKAPAPRTLTFEHTRHGKLQCTACHTNGKDMRAVPSCTSCHDDHHTEARSCTTCHSGAQDIKAHDRRVHTTCTGSGCHTSTVGKTLFAQRAVCLTCHSNMSKHEPAGDCASCHMIGKKAR